METPLCDPETGLCAIPTQTPEPLAAASTGEVLYVGDPMCSWCYGSSPGLHALEAEAGRRGIPFRVLVGGLRPGGGDPWNAQFKAFLRHHWEEIGARTGQPFTFRLLDRPAFNYDTEPSCRAFVVLRGLLEETGSAVRPYDVFAAIQRKFYAEGEDPATVAFYESICGGHGLDFQAFATRFEHADAKRATAAEFQQVRRLGVSGFPTVLYRDGSEVAVLAAGYAQGARLIDALDRATRRGAQTA